MPKKKPTRNRQEPAWKRKIDERITLLERQDPRNNEFWETMRDIWRELNSSLVYTPKKQFPHRHVLRPRSWMDSSELTCERCGLKFNWSVDKQRYIEYED